MTTVIELLAQATEKAAAAKATWATDKDAAKTLLSQAEDLREQAQAQSVADEIEAEHKKAVDAQKAAEQAPPVNAHRDEVQTAPLVPDNKDEAPFKSLGDLCIALTNPDAHREKLAHVRSKGAGLEGYFDINKALGPKKAMRAVGSLRGAKAITGLSELVPADGGFLVDTDRMGGIMARTYGVGSLLSRVDMLPISAGSNGMTMYGEDETSRVDGSRRGGIRGYWAAEADEKTSSKPKFREIDLKLKKVIGLVYSTDELLADAMALEAWIMQNLPEELRFKIEDAIINGTGAGMPLGILNAGCTVSVAKETGQAATTVVAENISKMWARRWVGARDYVWLINQDVEPELDNLNLPVGTGGSLVYLPPGGFSEAPYGRIKGRPVLPIEYCATLGTVGDIILASLSEYQMIEKGGMQSASSIHVRFIYDETVFRFVARVDGQPKWDQPLTPFKGTNTVSPFVTLATRA